VKLEKAFADHNGNNVTTYRSQPIKTYYKHKWYIFDGLGESYPAIDSVLNAAPASVVAIDPRQSQHLLPFRFLQYLYNLAMIRIVVHMMSSLLPQQRGLRPYMSHRSM
jgi:hypothetical protein